MVHDSEPHGTNNAICAAYELLRPRSVTLSSTITAASFAQVILTPDDRLTANGRRFAMEHPIVCCHVRGVEYPALIPSGFNQRSLRWAIQSATHIALSCAEYPKSKNDLAWWGSRAVENGARFILIIEYPVEKFIEWLDVIRRWKRPESSLQFVGLENVEVAV
jgi:hypothetical protein